jgi:hypothetical protein
MGYRSNVAYLWESGRNFPSAATLFGVAARVGIDPTQAVGRFYAKPAAWVTEVDLTTAAGVARLLRDLKGNRSVSEIARAMKRNRYAVNRWFKGATQPRLPEFLQLIEVCTLRLLDFLACLVDPATLPATRRRWISLRAARATVSDAPWSQAVLHALELARYKQLPEHEAGWIAQRVGISEEEELRCLNLLAQSGQIRWHKRRWVPRAVSTVDTRPDPDASRKLATWCASLGADHLRQGLTGNFAFNVFAVSEKDLERLRQLQRDYFSQLRNVVAESQPGERVVVANMQLFALSQTQ